jgi:hypothetical protein
MPMQRTAILPTYKSYLLRFWLEKGNMRSSLSNDESNIHWHPEWRFSLEDPHSGERIGFANLEQLVCFIEQQTTLTAPTE